MKLSKLYKTNKRLTKAALYVCIFGWLLMYGFSLAVIIDVFKTPLNPIGFVYALPISLLLSTIHTSYILVDLNRIIKKQNDK